jgi:CheY-like chemotaxis protein
MSEPTLTPGSERAAAEVSAAEVSAAEVSAAEVSAAEVSRPEPDADRTRQVWVANQRLELLTPVNALLDLSAMLVRDASERGHETFLRDQEQIHASAQRLLALIDVALDPATTPSADDLAHRLRHDLRTPLTEIIGLCEIWLEEAAGEFLEGFLGDLRQLHALSQRLLSDVDAILQFGHILHDGGLDLEHADAEPILDVVKELQPVERYGRPHAVGAILIVDDNAINRASLHRRLDRDGHAVAAAANGREALAQARAHTFDLILLDVIMPEMNGLEVLGALKADPQLRHIPVIMISAFHELDSVVRCIEMGAEDYLPKPCNPVLLHARIDACLEKKQLRDREVRHLQEIERERSRADELLHVILPAPIVSELKSTNAVQPRRFDNVAVMFADIVGFTPYCDGSRPEDVVPHLQNLVERAEELALRHGVEKIKTVGDAFMAASGLLQATDNPVLNCLHFGLELITACRCLPTAWELRVGIHVGTVVAGVIGRRQYLFDLWGDTVNTAARMESRGWPGAVTLSGTAWGRVSHCCRGATCARVQIKGKGEMDVVRFDSFVGGRCVGGP